MAPVEVAAAPAEVEVAAAPMEVVVAPMEVVPVEVAAAQVAAGEVLQLARKYYCVKMKKNKKVIHTE